MFAAMLALHDTPCLVVGGGGVALRKVNGLLAEGARVTVLADRVVDRVAHLAHTGDITLLLRPYRPGDTEGYALVFAATGNRNVNRAISIEARAHGIWVNVADDPELCTFHLPAVVKRGPLRIALASSGTAPFVIRRLRKLFDDRLGPEWSEWIAAACRFRHLVRSLIPRGPLRELLYDRFFEASVDTTNVTVRVPTEDELATILETGAPLSPRRLTEAAVGERRTAPSSKQGFVSLVGAGPGCPALLTLRGYQRLMHADAVVYDRLAAPALPPSLPESTELHAVGKQPGRHPVPQEEINALLIRLARQGLRVVRLKGGDPFIFGRGGEEALALAQAGIPFEIVPGISAGLAAPAFAGIPVTCRNEAVSVTFLTAHECAKPDGPQVRWDLLAQNPHGTIVGFMGVSSLPTTTRALMDAGMDPATPAALIERGSTSAQREVRATLGTLSAVAREAHIRPPALFCIGPTVRYADRLHWKRRLPLTGRRFMVSESVSHIGTLLELIGAEVITVPLPLTPAARIALLALPLTDCVVATPDEVDLLDDERGHEAWPAAVTAWCMNPDAASRARERGWLRVELIDGNITAETVRNRLRRGCAQAPTTAADPGTATDETANDAPATAHRARVPAGMPLATPCEDSHGLTAQSHEHGVVDDEPAWPTQETWSLDGLHRSSSIHEGRR